MLDFASPIWLTGLIPWGALSYWLLRGRRRSVEVPFLVLWDRPETKPAVSRAIHLPPWPIRFALSAALAALAAAAGPAWHAGPATAAVVTVVIDRGQNMSSRNSGVPRFIEAVGAAANAIRAQRISVTGQLVAVPGGPIGSFDSTQWLAQAAILRRTAISTNLQLRETVAAALAKPGASVILLSDQAIDLPPDAAARVIRIVPPPSSPRVGIETLAGSESPHPQIMVRLVNSGPARSVQISIESGSAAVQRVVELPADGSTDSFEDLPALGDVIHARLVDYDGTEADDQAWLVRQAGWPAIEAGSALPPPVARMIALFRRDRPPSPHASRVTVVAGDAAQAAAQGDMPAMIFPATTQPAPNQSVATEATVSIIDSELTRDVDWRRALAGARLASPPPAGWTPIVSLGVRGVVWTKTQPVRQIWVGFWSDVWPMTPAFVIFCTRAMTWTGGGPMEWTARRPGQLGDEWARDQQSSPLPAGIDPTAGWWPGVYRRADGAMLAINASPVATYPSSSDVVGEYTHPTRTQLAREAVVADSVPLGRAVAALAAVLAAMSVFAWAGVARRERMWRKSGEAARLI